MIVFRPLEITNTNLISTSLFETSAITWSAGDTYSIDTYVSVVGTLGELLIYKSLQNGNIGNIPSSSPTWWVYSSSIYEQFDQGKAYPFGYQVYDSATKGLYKSVTENNINVLDPLTNVPWFQIGTNTSTLPSEWDAATTYNIGDRVLLTLTVPPTAVVLGDPSDIMVYQKIWVSNINGNLNLEPDPNPPYLPPGPWTEDKTHPVPWVKTVGYADGRVVYTPDNKLWQTTLGCQGIIPSLTYSTTWVKVGTTNKWAAFDQTTSSQAKANNLMTFTVSAPQIDSVILMNVIAETATVTVRDGLGGTIIYTETRDLLAASNSSTITDWWEYFNANFDVLSSSTNVLFKDLPISANSYVTVTLESTDAASTTDNIFLGDLIFSRARELSLTNYGLQTGIRDFSVVTEDGFGGQTFNKRRNRRRMNTREWVTHDQFNRTFRILTDLPATPCIWLAADVDYLSEAMMIKAWYKDFTAEIVDVNAIFANLELEGLL